jgi:glycosyltransferase involved in cell wall biosynthesis
MPKVSVIIPSYNHARYLPQRLDSVLDQTFQDFEVLFLDDSSPDDSLAVFAAHASSTDPRVRAIFNETNSGSTFKQWNRGFRETTGEYVWIAESDDYADPSLLAELVARLDDHPNVGLAYCQSWVVNGDGVIIRAGTDYTDALDREHWLTDFVAGGRDECARYMTQMNAIPNASAVLLRRSVMDRVGPVPEDFKLNGDWAFWVRMLLAADVAFVARPLNYFRNHEATVRSRSLRVGVTLEEMIRIRGLIGREVGLSAASRRALAESMAYTWLYSLDGGSGERIPLQFRLRLLWNMARFDRRAAEIVALEPLRWALRRLGLGGAARAMRRALSRDGGGAVHSSNRIVP